MKRRTVLLVIVAMLIPSIVFAGGVAGMFEKRNTEEQDNGYIVQDKNGVYYEKKEIKRRAHGNRAREESKSSISEEIILPGASINNQPAHLIYEDQDKAVYGGPGSVYEKNTAVGVIILGK